MGYQSEAQLEKQLLKKMIDELKYDFVTIKDEGALESNFRIELNRLNIDNLQGGTLTDKEFERILIYLKGKSVFQSSKQLRDKYQLVRDNGDYVYITFIDFENFSNNHFQVTNQINMVGTYKNRYDVTILLNGLPITQIELKRRGVHIKEAFNQMVRYASHSYVGLFKYLQILVISNGVDTKYFANGDEKYKYGYTFFWSDENNNRITNLNDFADDFLKRNHIYQMIDTFMVLNDTDKLLMVLRPYQVYAVKGIVKMAKETANGGFCWHSTGSGKTLTSFKVSQILAKEPDIKKVIFVVDRNDLDSQTLEEFNKFEEGSVDSTDSTKILVDQMKDVSQNLIITTVQKLNYAVKSKKYKKVMDEYRDEKVIIIIDECHRSQFGTMYTNINRHFNKAQFFGFTGTPRFKENKSQDGRTTADIFGKCIHSYMTKDAIFDKNVLGFSVEYIETFKGQYDDSDDSKVQAIDTKEVFENDERLNLVANHIAKIHSAKTINKKFNAIFATPNIKTLNKYYKELKSLDTDLKIAGIYTFDANEDPEGKSQHSREILDEMIKDYNSMFGTSFTTETFASYKADISKRVKNGQIDIVLVVKMFLTGFDSKLTSTIYIDKNLVYHDLLQSYSRTNRIFDEHKQFGQIVCYRNLKTQTNEAIKLFNNSDTVDDVLQQDYLFYVGKFRKSLGALSQIVDKPSDVDSLYEESKQKEFVVNFKDMAGTLLALQTFVDFEFSEDEIGIDEQTFEDFKSKYLMLYENHKKNRDVDKESILDEIDFEIELVQTDRINVEYILNLIKDIDRKTPETRDKDIEHIVKEIDRTDNKKLLAKSSLIKAFLEKELLNVDPDKTTIEAFHEYEDDERNREISEFAKSIDIDEDYLRTEIARFEFEEYIDRERLNNYVKKPLLKKIQTVNTIIDFITENLYKYEN